MKMRTEHDFLGEMKVPSDALYGIHTLRAVANFPDRIPFHIEWYKSVGMVKKACYLTLLDFRKAISDKYRDNPERAQHYVSALRLPDPEIIHHLAGAADEVISGHHFDSFLVPAVSGGAGTSINMNVNEIITNLALRTMGRNEGDYTVIDPVEHANMFQSTNDVIPTSLKVSVMFLLQELEEKINSLRYEVEEYERKGSGLLRSGFTQMQAAVPSTFGKLFGAYCEALSRDWWRVSKCAERIKPVNIGGSAIGTGMAVPRFFIMEVINNLKKITSLPVARSENLPDATSNHDSLVEVHATLKAHAVNLEKMVSDLRLLSSETGIPLIKLPQVQVGSSIMPGKINPVIPEFVISATHKIYANDQIISSLTAQGCLELNAYIPVIGHALIESLKLLIACDKSLTENLFKGLTIHPEEGLQSLMKSPSITTALNPFIGYNHASELAKYMKTNHVDVFSANEVLQLVAPEKLRKILEADNLLKLGFVLEDLD